MARYRRARGGVGRGGPRRETPGHTRTTPCTRPSPTGTSDDRSGRSFTSRRPDSFATGPGRRQRHRRTLAVPGATRLRRARNRHLAAPVEQARSKARWRRIDAEFLVWDALDLAELAGDGLSFRTVVDSAMFHQFGDDERRRFIDGLGSVVPAGGLYAVLGDARSSARPTYGISPAELRERFQSRAGWTVEFVVETVFERRHSRNRAYFAGVRRRSG